MGLYNKQVVQYLSKATKVAETEIRRMIEDAGRETVDDVDKEIPLPEIPKPNNLDQTLKAYADQCWSDIDNYVNQTLVTTQYGVGAAQKAYTDVLNKTTAMFNSGIYTFDQSLEKAIDELAQKGIDSGMTDKGGHRWSLEGYVRTVLKSTLNNTYNELRKIRMADYDVHTVLVTSHAGPRPACSRIQGHVVDLRRPEELPAGWSYKSIYDPYWQAEYREPGGHRGVNCRHLHIPYVPGVSTNNQPTFDKSLNERVEKARETQRRIEREIVKYKKNAMVSEEMGSDRAGYWRMMVRKRQKAMREHLRENGEYLRRDYKREKVYVPLSTLLKDFDYKN